MEANYRSTFPFCLVQFIEEGTISVVPTLWLFEEDGNVFTWWPNENVKRHATFRSNPQENWKMFPVRVMHYSRNYKTANDSLRFFEMHTDIELCSEEEDSPSLISPSPKLRSPMLRKAPETSSLNLETQFLSFVDHSQTQCGSCQENRAILDTVVTKLNYVLEELGEIKQQLPRSDLPCDTPLLANYPLASVEDVQSLEEDLADQETFFKLVKYLGQHGGRDVNDCTRRVLPLLMTNATSRGINWVGGFGKVGMKNFPRILQLIAVAVRQTEKKAKQAEVEEVVKKWLRCAADRDGGRNKRKTMTE